MLKNNNKKRIKKINKYIDFKITARKKNGYVTTLRDR